MDIVDLNFTRNTFVEAFVEFHNHPYFKAFQSCISSFFISFLSILRRINKRYNPLLLSAVEEKPATIFINQCEKDPLLRDAFIIIGVAAFIVVIFRCMWFFKYRKPETPNSLDSEFERNRIFLKEDCERLKEIHESLILALHYKLETTPENEKTPPTVDSSASSSRKEQISRLSYSKFSKHIDHNDNDPKSTENEKNLKGGISKMLLLVKDEIDGRPSAADDMTQLQNEERLLKDSEAVETLSSFDGFSFADDAKAGFRNETVDPPICKNPTANETALHATNKGDYRQIESNLENEQEGVEICTKCSKHKVGVDFLHQHTDDLIKCSEKRCLNTRKNCSKTNEIQKCSPDPMSIERNRMLLKEDRERLKEIHQSLLDLHYKRATTLENEKIPPTVDPSASSSRKEQFSRRSYSTFSKHIHQNDNDSKSTENEINLEGSISKMLLLLKEEIDRKPSAADDTIELRNKERLLKDSEAIETLSSFDGFSFAEVAKAGFRNGTVDPPICKNPTLNETAFHARNKANYRQIENNLENDLKDVEICTECSKRKVGQNFLHQHTDNLIKYSESRCLNTCKNCSKTKETQKSSPDPLSIERKRMLLKDDRERLKEINQSLLALQYERATTLENEKTPPSVDPSASSSRKEQISRRSYSKFSEHIHHNDYDPKSTENEINLEGNINKMLLLLKDEIDGKPSAADDITELQNEELLLKDSEAAETLSLFDGFLFAEDAKAGFRNETVDPPPICKNPTTNETAFHARNKANYRQIENDLESEQKGVEICMKCSKRKVALDFLHDHIDGLVKYSESRCFHTHKNFSKTSETQKSSPDPITRNIRPLTIEKISDSDCQSLDSKKKSRKKDSVNAFAKKNAFSVEILFNRNVKLSKP